MADQIRDTQIVRTPEVVIDPQFFVPEDVVGARAATQAELIPDDPDQDFLSGIEYDPLIIDNSDPSSTGDTSSTGSTSGLDTPWAVSVLSQTVHSAPDGHAVVDVVLLVSDVQGAANYEVRIN